MSNNKLKKIKYKIINELVDMMNILNISDNTKKSNVEKKENTNKQTKVKKYIINYTDNDNININSNNSKIQFIKNEIYKSEILNNSVVNNLNNKVLTEDLGKIFEKAICLLYDIDYVGNYKYSFDDAISLKNRISKLRDVFPYQIKHIANNGNKYDFVTLTENNIYLSAKTTKKDGKVCPQVIGQPSKKKFCEFFDIDKTYSLEQIKKYIENNVDNLLKTYELNTFDCPIIYYNKDKNSLLFIKLITQISWNYNTITFSHINNNKLWNESSSIYINKINIGEFQIHNHRDCIKFRWSFENILDMFKCNFEIIEL